jgi:hypothetical protein
MPQIITQTTTQPNPNSIIYKLTDLFFQIQTQNHQNKSLSTTTSPLLLSSVFLPKQPAHRK